MSEIVITMNDALSKSRNVDCARVVIKDDAGVKCSRIVTMESLIAAFRVAAVEKVKAITVGEIPFGYYDGQVAEKQGKFGACMVAVLPSGRQMMKYEDTMYDVCLPALVFSFTVDQERIVNTCVFVMADEKPADKSRLYRYPFGNVGMNGSVCWGGNRLPTVKSLKDLEEAMLLFINSPTNNDYYQGKDYCAHAELSQRELFEILKDKNRYPEEYLVPVKEGKRPKVLRDLMPWRKK